MVGPVIKVAVAPDDRLIEHYIKRFGDSWWWVESPTLEALSLGSFVSMHPLKGYANTNDNPVAPLMRVDLAR